MQGLTPFPREQFLVRCSPPRLRALLVSWTLVVVAIALAAATTSPAPAATSDYTFTIYVEEGIPNGHVFMSLSNGTDNVTKGFYTKYKSIPGKALGLVALGGGKVRDDSRTDWSFRRVYRINQTQYDTAQNLLHEWENGNRTWWINNHCGDFVEGFAKAMGIAPDLKWGVTGRNRPAIFGAYLMAHGGETSIQHASTSDVLARMDKLFRELTRTRAQLRDMDIEKDRNLRAAESLKAQYQAVHDPQYAAYLQRCNVTLPPDEAAQRKTECEAVFRSLQKLRLDFDARRQPYIDAYKALDAKEEALRPNIDAQQQALGAIVEVANARNALRKAACTSKSSAEDQARCYLTYRNNGNM